MKVFKVIADERPAMCILCPVYKLTAGDCGKMITRKSGGWSEGFKAPDSRCVIEVKRKGDNT